VSAFFFTVALFAVVYSIPSLRSLAAGLTAGAGILAAVAAFASQAALANLIGGVFIVIFRPFRVEDRIAVGNLYEGYVEDITLRHTVIRSWENKRIVIPNSVISKEIIVNNDLSDEITCRFMEIPLSHQSDYQRAIALIQAQVHLHPNYVDHRTPEDLAEDAPPVRVRVIRYTDAGVVLRAYLWGDMAKTFVMACDLREQLQPLFAAAGIKMGVPHRIWYGEEAGQVSPVNESPKS
jgi:small-conductance mechanosensitive channel